MKPRYEIVVAPGCHREPSNPHVSYHRTLAAAVQRAMRSDRVRVELSDFAVCLFQAKSQQPTAHGYGLYGGRHVGKFTSALAQAQAAERAYLER